MPDIVQLMIAAAQQGQLARARELDIENEERAIEQEARLGVAKKEYALGNVQPLREMDPAGLANLQQAELQRRSTEMKTAEDKQQIRDKMLATGFRATLADPQNWYGFRRAAITSKMFEPDELAEEPPAPELIQKNLGAMLRSGTRSAPHLIDLGMRMKQQWTSEPIYKTTQDVLTSWEKFKRTPDSGAGDLSLIYGLIRMLDPGSVVRGEEVKLTDQASPLAYQLKGWYERLFTSKGRLPEGMRTQYFDVAKNLFTAQRDVYNEKAKAYRDWAMQQDVDPDLVVLPSDLLNNPVGTQSQPTSTTPFTQDQIRQLEEMERQGIPPEEAIKRLGVQK